MKPAILILVLALLIPLPLVAQTDHETEVLAAYGERVAAHNEAADVLWAQAESAKAGDDVKAAIQACLDIRADCYVADGESAAKARAMLAAFRADAAVAKKHGRLLKGTEDWK